MKVISFSAEKYYKIAYDSFFYIEDIKKAYKYIDYALRQDSGHIKSLKLKGTVLIFEDKINDALKVWQALNETVADDFEILLRLAYCYEKTNNYALAFEFCQKSAQYVKLGDWERMCALYRFKIDLLLEVKRKNSAQKLFANALKMLNSEYGALLKRDYPYLSAYNEPSVVKFKNIKKVL